MRKTSQDGGESSAGPSGIENEVKKSGAILKTKRSSIKRKVQSLSHESDDAVIEPLLQKDKEKINMSNQSAKYELLSQTKTEISNEWRNDKEKLLADDKTQNSTLPDARNVTETIVSICGSNQLPKFTSGTAPLHNHMNTNVFSCHDALKGVNTMKSQILVEIDGSKQAGYNPSPLIFTTAKIHTDGKNKHMEPLQVTPVPILSTIEVSVLKGPNVNTSVETSGLITSNISPIFTNTPKTNVNTQDKDQKLKSTIPGIISTAPSKIVDSKVISTKDKNIMDAVNVESKKDKDGKQTKPPISQTISGPSSGMVRTTTTSGTSKPAITAVDTKNSLVSQLNKGSTTGAPDQSIKQDKTDDTKRTERKTDLIKNTSLIDSCDPSRSEAFDNKSVTTGMDKVGTVSMASGTKQQQGQKPANDKDDRIMQTKSGINRLPLKSDSKSLKQLDDCAASIPISIPETKSSGNDVSNMSDKMKLPMSTANNVQITRHVASTKPSVTNIASTTANKSATSNSIASAKAIVTSHSSANPLSKTSVTKIADSAVSPPLTKAKPLPSNVTSESDTKYADVPISKQHTTRTMISKPSTSIISDTKTGNISTVEIASITSPPISKSESTATQPVTKVAVVKSVPQPKVTKATDVKTKGSSISTSAAKGPSVSTNIAKISSVTASTAKTTPISTSTIKTAPVSTSTTKNAPVSISTVKSTPASTKKESSVKSPVLTSASKIPITKSTITSISKATVASPSTSNTISATRIITTTAPAGITANSAVSNKKTEAKSTELSNGNKNFKA